jgi:hypothetical protein
MTDLDFPHRRLCVSELESSDQINLQTASRDDAIQDAISGRLSIFLCTKYLLVYPDNKISAKIAHLVNHVNHGEICAK